MMTVQFVPDSRTSTQYRTADPAEGAEVASEKQWFRVQAIGYVRRPGTGETAPDEYFDPWQESVLEIDDRWAAGLAGIEDFSHLVVFFYLDRAERRRTAGEPRQAEDADGLTPVGFFSTRTPKRPNPIGIACPRLNHRDGNKLYVAGLDAWDGTPIIDVKGYYPRDEQRPDATIPGWLELLWSRHDAERSSS
jgi:tRNA-Thr(GGU) m(6)t(6)A37 methyltransferase TsaA